MSELDVVVVATVKRIDIVVDDNDDVNAEDRRSARAAAFFAPVFRLIELRGEGRSSSRIIRGVTLSKCK